jgi:hypothetical protein
MTSKERADRTIGRSLNICRCFWYPRHQRMPIPADPENATNCVDQLKVSLSKHAEIITGVTPVRLTTPSACVTSSWFDNNMLAGGGCQVISWSCSCIPRATHRRALSSPYIIMSGWLTEEAQLILPCSPNAYHQKVQMIFNRLSGSTPNVFRSIRRTSYPFMQAPTIWGYFSLY